MQLRDLAESKRDTLMMDPRILQVDEGYNLRDLTTPDEMEDLDQLARDIANNGFLAGKPITIRLKDDGAFVVDGHRRRAATMIAIEKYGADIASIPCIAEPKGTNEADRTADIFVSNNGKPLNALAKVKGIKRLQAWGWDNETIAKRCGLGSAQNVENYLVLGAASVAVQEMVRNDEVSASTAVNTVRKHGEKAGAVLADAKIQAASEGKSRVTTAHVKASTGEFQATAGNIKTMIGALQTIAEDGDGDAAQIASDALEKIGVLKKTNGAAAAHRVAAE